MRDEMDGRLWVDHHEGLSEAIDRTMAALRAGIARLALWDGSSHQLMALAAAFLITALTFNTTSA